MRGLYKERHKWAWYAVGHIFTAGLCSTQRNESLNNALKKRAPNCKRGMFVDMVSAFKQTLDSVVRRRDKKHGSTAHYFCPSEPDWI